MEYQSYPGQPTYQNGYPQTSYDVHAHQRPENQSQQYLNGYAVSPGSLNQANPIAPAPAANYARAPPPQRDADYAGNAVPAPTKHYYPPPPPPSHSYVPPARLSPNQTHVPPPGFASDQGYLPPPPPGPPPAHRQYVPSPSPQTVVSPQQGRTQSPYTNETNGRPLAGQKLSAPALTPSSSFEHAPPPIPPKPGNTGQHSPVYYDPSVGATIDPNPPSDQKYRFPPPPNAAQTLRPQPAQGSYDAKQQCQPPQAVSSPQTSALSPPPPPPYTPNMDMLPFVIPQIASSLQGGYMCPFVRAYPPDIAQKGISQVRFLQFIDGLNEAYIQSPVFEAANHASLAMGFAWGSPTLQATSAVLGIAAMGGGFAVSMMRTKSYMQKQNEELFHPLGLHSQVLTTKKMLPVIHYPANKIELLPMEHPEQEQAQNGETPTDTTPGHDALTRRHEALKGWVQPLSFDVPPPPKVEKEDGMLKRMNDWQANRRAEKQKKALAKRRTDNEQKRQEQHDKAADEQQKLDEEMMKLDARMQQFRFNADERYRRAAGNPAEIDRIQQDYETEYRAVEAERTAKIRESEQEIQKLKGQGDEHRVKTDAKEEKAANKIRWVVITKWDPNSSGGEVEDEDNAKS